MSRPGRILSGLFRDASGISLIEVLICSLVVSMGAVALALMLGTSQATIAGEGDNRVAVYLAQQKIERCRALGFAYVDATGSPCLTTDKFDSALTAVASNQFYTRTTAIDCVDANNYASPVDCSTAKAAKRVAVTVQSNQNTRTRNITLTAVLAHR